MQIKNNEIAIYGKHVLEEALSCYPKAVSKIFLAPDFRDEKIEKLFLANKIPKVSLDKNKLPVGLAPDSAYQGIIAIIDTSKILKDYDEFIRSLKISENTSLVILGEIQDPQNVGAITRSAGAFGISGVLIPEHNQAGITPSVVKVSAGMIFRVPIVSVKNINTVIRDLKDKGFWIYGLESDGKKKLSEEKFDKPAVFVLGNEEKGIREKTKEVCDIMLSITISDRCESLNVATSASVALYEWSKGKNLDHN